MAVVLLNVVKLLEVFSNPFTISTEGPVGVIEVSGMEEINLGNGNTIFERNGVNLYVATLDKMGIRVVRFSDSAKSKKRSVGKPGSLILKDAAANWLVIFLKAAWPCL
jgi:hypothetical protein